jgi:hypothetical protein
VPLDAFYTAAQIAETLLAQATILCPSTVADFSAGTGSLLSAAHLKWPTAKLLAIDHDPSALSVVTEQLPNSTVCCADFLDPVYQSKICKAASACGAISLIVANPPFSCRGGTKLVNEVDGRTFTASLALSFVIGGVRYLDSKGEILAILPASCLNSEKDWNALRQLERLFSVQVVGGASRSAFKGCAAATVFVRFTRKVSEQASVYGDREDLQVITSRTFGAFRIFRGSIQMHAVPDDVDEAAIPFVHTTELSKYHVILNRRWVRTRRSRICGPAILLPRVGMPREHKVCLLQSKRLVAISDCVFAITCQDSASIQDLYHILQGSWRKLESLYIGTGARYITVHRLSNFLREVVPFCVAN